MGEYTKQKERRVSIGKGWCSSALHLAQKLCLECKDKVSKKEYITLVTGNTYWWMETESQAYTYNASLTVHNSMIIETEISIFPQEMT